MRTTLTLDDDVAAKVQAEARRSGQSFKATVNDALRRGLNAKRERKPRAPFRVRVRDLGSMRAGLSLDNIGGLLDAIEGPDGR